MPKQSINRGLRHGEGSVRAHGRGWSARWREASPHGTVLNRSRTFPTRDEAEDFLRSLHRAKRDGRYIPPSEMTVGDVIEGWLLRGSHRWKAWTDRTYRDRAVIHVLPFIGDVRADALTTHRVQHWIDQLVRSGLAPATVDASITVLRAAMKEAVALEIVRRNPVSGVKGPMVTIKESPTWTADDVTKVIAAIREQPKWFALYRLAITCGMRPGELRALKWEDLDASAGVLTVRRTFTRDAENRVTVGKSTKTGRSRQIPLPAGVLAALAAWRTEQKTCQLACLEWHNDGIMFDRGNGAYLPVTTWQRFHAKMCTGAGVPLLTLHQAVRHTTATLELAAGTNPKIVSDRLGHSGIQVTLDRYSHVSLDTQRNATDALDRRLFGHDMLPRTAGDDSENVIPIDAKLPS